MMRTFLSRGFVRFAQLFASLSLSSPWYDEGSCEIVQNYRTGKGGVVRFLFASLNLHRTELAMMPKE
jgi:hypothetical protein